jgi:hypothetical protein
VNPTVILQILAAALQLAETGSEVATFLEGVATRIRNDQAAGVDVSAADWSYLDAAAATNVAEAEQLEGKSSSSTAN